MYRKSLYRIRYERKAARCSAMRAAKARKRSADTFDSPDWTRIRTVLVAVWAHRDGRHVALRINGRQFRCGCERAVRGVLARELYRR